MKANPSNYDAWFDYLRLMEAESQDVESVREIYERAIANTPPTQVGHLVLTHNINKRTSETEDVICL